MKIEISGVNMVYPSGKQALDNVSLILESPNLIGLLGPNGAGKSTLMKLLTASLLPTSGQIVIDGHPLASSEKELKKQLGYLPQSFGLFDELTVWQFTDYMASLKGLNANRESIENVLFKTNLMEKSKAKIRTLSGGQRQRVGIAQALLGSPSLLIFDEPTSGLDPEERIHFRNLFSRAAENKIVLLSTHIIEDIQSICNQLIVINHGRILFTGTPSDLIQAAQGHVGVFEQSGAENPEGLTITARLNTAHGITCRAIAKQLPAFVTPTEPTLEDAYLYCMSQEVTP